MERLRTMNRRLFLAGSASILAGSALLAACGGDNDDDAPEATQASESTQAPSEATQAPAGAASPTAGEDDAGSSPTTGSTPTDSTPPAEGSVESLIDTSNIQQGGHATLAINGDVSTFMPIIVTDANSFAVTSLVYEGLMLLNPDTLEPTPILADSWEVDEASKAVTFSLKQGVTWHDGEPFTADDVKLSFDLAGNPDTGSTSSATLGATIASVEVSDPQTVVVTVQELTATLMTDLLPSVTIMPSHLLADAAPADIMTHDLAANPVGTGPFVFNERRVGEYVMLDKNPDYHRGAPALDQFIVKVAKDNTAMYQQLKTGEVDILAITPAFYDDASKQENIDLRTYPTFGFQCLGFNLDEAKGSPFLQDVRVRQALCYAIDRQGIVDNIENGLSEVAIGLYSSLSWAYAPDEIELTYPYDPEQASALLDEAGWVLGDGDFREKDGERLKFVVTSLLGSKRFEGFLAVIQENWKAVGVDMEVQNEEFSAFIASITSEFDYEIFILGNGVSADPDQTTLWACDQYPNGNNLVAYCNPEVDDLMKQGLATFDTEERKRIYVEAQNKILADMPMFITTFSTAIMGTNKRLKNYVANAVDNFDVLHAPLWYVTDGK